MRLSVPVPSIITPSQNGLLLLLAPSLDIDREGAGHGDDVRIDLVAWNVTFWRNIERPGQSTEEGEKFEVREFDAGAGATAIAECHIAADVGELGQRLLVGWVGGIKPALWDELVAVGELLRFAGDEAEVYS